ncbi:MAG: trypsin-like peptidase domain-containing protein [Verrucomicrobiales bacterium]|jgi:S1-C subfamily serine protease|nr:trypsin-like peptidase domain-containing protein [Verrucomicrobiales bacterium]MBP9225313.1 trypsin-like peptidase domain-containing protein [Verrucomicrobiales bacterium]HQZ29140.1 trypsin-like peptidase domain-containing protein [Verrucomicrobiales bacterium]
MKSSRFSVLRAFAPLAVAILLGLSISIAQQGPAPGPRLANPVAPPAPAAVTGKLEADIPPPEVQTDISEIEFDAIVRVDVDTKQPNYRVPWNVGGLSSGNGTGFLVGPNRFLTNAHVVSDNRLIYIKKVSDPKPYLARVVNVAHDCDLALLELESEIDFETGFKGVKPLFIGGIPKLNTTVVAIGYPIGGDRISVTRGIVSRIDFRAYSHSGVDNHLAIQIDAAINPGNSGGPVLQNNQVVGVAFQGYSGNVAQNTGYMIPVPVIARFLKDTEDGKYDHYVDMAASMLNILNPAQRRALDLPNDGIGVMVADADAAGSAGGVLETKDVLLSIDGHPIASDGFIEIDGERVDLNEIIERKFAGDTVDLEVWRDGALKQMSITLKRFLPYLIQAEQYDKQPNFVLYAGLQFQPLDRNMMQAHNITDLDTRYFYSFYAQDEIYKERPQVIVLTEVLPDSTNTHLQPFVHRVIDSINGKKIALLQDVYDAFHGDFHEEGHEAYHVVRLHNEERPLVLKRSDAAVAHDRIKAQYNVSSDHFIERPEILDLKDLIQPEKAKPETESTTDTEKKEVPKAKEKLPEPARKAA